MLEIDWNFIVVFALVWILVLVLSRVFLSQSSELEKEEKNN